MPRKREVHAVNGHPCEWAGGTVYIRLRRKGDPSAGFVVVSPSGEEMRKRFDDAQRLAAQRAATAGAASAFDELWLTVHHFLEVDPPSSWSEGFVETMKSVLLPWLGTKGFTGYAAP